jgi:hypothetical protein
MILVAVGLAAFAAGAGARSAWSAGVCAFAVLCWISLVILAEQIPEFYHTEFASQVAAEFGRASTVCMLAFIGYGLRQLMKAMRRWDRPF